MQVTEKTVEGLRRTWGVTVPASELDALLVARIAEITPTLRLKGFRPGKVPAGHIRKVYGKALMGEVVDKSVSETSQKLLEDNQLRVAAQPDLAHTSDIEQVLAGKQDLAFDITVEVMPDFEPTDVSALKLERPVYTPDAAELAEAMAELVAQNRTYAARTGKKIEARQGDQLLVDFTGTIDGEPFEGGAATDAEIVIGAGRFLPGFEDQLVGAGPNKAVTVNTDFPADYPVARLKGKSAVFEVTVKEVRAPKDAAADDALAQQLGHDRPRSAQRRPADQSGSQLRQRLALQGHACGPGCARRAPRHRPAAQDGRGGIRRDLGPARGREGSRRDRAGG